MEMPDTTRAQILALFTAVLATAAAFGLPISDAQSAALIGLGGAISTALPIADALIRRGRANMIGQQAQADATLALAAANQGLPVGALGTVNRPQNATEFDPAEAEADARKALAAELGREPTDAEVHALLDEGEIPAGTEGEVRGTPLGMDPDRPR